MNLFGEYTDVLDLNNHKPGVDLRRAQDEGWFGLGLKATEGDYFVDRLFSGYLDQARNIGMPVFGYHWQIKDSPIRDQVALVRQVVPLDCPLALDVERYHASNGRPVHSGGPEVSRPLTAALRDAGYRVLWTYLPRWYWSELGAPDLAGLPPLWGSHYPDYLVRRRRGALPFLADSAFDGYGGLPMTMLQYSSSVAASNYAAGSLDGNVWKGSPAAFRGLIEGTPSRVPFRNREEAA